MRRRDFVAAALGAGVVGGAALYRRSEGDGGTVEPVEVPTLDAPGSSAGVETVPRPGEVSFVEVFATWCGVCQGMMGHLGEVHGEVGDEVQFVSVTNEPVGHTVSREEVADWWRANGGSWTVGVDEDLLLTERLSATELPRTVVLDEDNHVVWSASGRKSREEMLGAVESAL